MHTETKTVQSLLLWQIFTASTEIDVAGGTCTFGKTVNKLTVDTLITSITDQFFYTIT
jgi:hypothetical protein